MDDPQKDPLNRIATVLEYWAMNHYIENILEKQKPDFPGVENKEEYADYRRSYALWLDKRAHCLATLERKIEILR